MRSSHHPLILGFSYPQMCPIITDGLQAAIAGGTLLVAAAAVYFPLAAAEDLPPFSDSSPPAITKVECSGRLVIREASASELLEYFGSLVPLHAQTLEENFYNGRWICWEGSVVDIRNTSDGFEVIFREPSRSEPSAFVSFSSEWSHEMEALRRDDRTRYEAAIEQIGVSQIDLTDGVLLGILDDVRWQQRVVHLAPGDVLLLYTDGITEAQNAQEAFFDEDRLREVVRANLGRSARDIQDSVIAQIGAFVGDAPQSDDITLMVIVRGPTEAG